MSLIVDTDVAIHLRDGDEPFVQWAAVNADPIAVSMVTVIELQPGLYAPPALMKNRTRGYRDLLAFVRVLDVDQAVVEAYGDILRTVGFSRNKLLDRLIAATAIVHDLTLVTINGPDFREIPGLKLEVWPAPDQ